MLNPDTPCLIDLHLHLDGSISVSTARRIAEMQGINVPADDEELRQTMTLTSECHTLDDYLNRFVFACSLLHTREALSECAYCLMEEIRRQGVIYAEVRFAPQKSCDKGLTQREAIDAVIEGLRRSPMPSGLIIACMRGDDTHEANMETVRLCAEYLGKGVCGLDLAGAETLFPNELYEEEFALARQLNIPFTIHAGEGRGPESIDSAMMFGARRIGHGVRSCEDADTMRKLVDKNIILELCPTSNLHTGMYPGYANYPLRKLMDSGVKVTINTDNMTVSGTTLHDEWQHMIDAFSLTRAEIRSILLNSVDASFASDELKDTLRQMINEAYPRVYIRELSTVSDEDVENAIAKLPEWRREQVRAIKLGQGRKESTIAFSLLQQVLREEYGIEDSIEFDYLEHGKPVLKGRPDIFFNISHCREAVACIVGDTEVGVDIERKGRYKEILAKHVLNELELGELESSDDKDAEFTRLWTQKEALVKCLGVGVSSDMKNVLVENKDIKIKTMEHECYAYSVAFKIK